ncbi:MAG: DUF3466 family protein [Phycisphaeraceae bacterium]|nr:DUF3466 family protein [Phycisphaeraceae bacterium]MCW5755525.1 DUF3466 family protein [Phycisphaeraceae bacterium]
MVHVPVALAPITLAALLAVAAHAQPRRLMLAPRPIQPESVASQYSIKKIGPLVNGGGSLGSAINNLTQIAGTSLSQTAEQPYRWSGGMIEGLPITGSGTSNFAHGINNAGQVVGYASFPGTASEAALWTLTNSMGWQVTGLGIPSGFAFSIANDLSDDGTRIVGYADNAIELLVATSWERDDSGDWNMLDMGTLPHNYGSYANGLNNQGVAVGTSYVPFGTSQATHWQRTNTGWTISALPYLPNGYSQSIAFAINDSGLIAGAAVASDGYYHATTWSGNSITDFGTFSGEHSYARAINTSGTIVGETWGAGLTRAFIGSNSGLHDLNTRIPPDTGWNLRSATGINDSGQIVGTGDLGGFWHTFLLTPVAMNLTGPTPGVVGVPNTFSIIAPNDQSIQLYYAFSAGETAISGCSAVPLNIASPTLLATFPDPSSITIELPDEFSGQTVYFQAATGCQVSNVVRYTFP